MHQCAPVYVISVELLSGANHVSNDSKRVLKCSVIHVTLEISCTQKKWCKPLNHSRDRITHTHPMKAVTPMLRLVKLYVVTLRM